MSQVELIDQSHTRIITSMVAFDVAETIAEFLADSERTTLELPHMTTGQRKSTKKLLEQYPQLRSESFGFGAERQLHIFKECAAEVKQIDKPAIMSPDRSTTGSLTQGSSVGGSPVTNDGEVSLPVLHEELQVRNTFIHIEDAPIDERVVQSMPHGMFRQCILSERSKEAAAPVVSMPSSEPEAEPMVYDTDDEPDDIANLSLSPGALVVVEGLVKLPAFNGRSAVIQSFDEQTGRYNVLIASSGGCQQAKVKAENLRVILPCP